VGVGSTVLQVDCGTHEDPDVALCGLMKTYRRYRGPELFVISHFHADHYNGLVRAAESFRERRFAIREVYYPRLPDIPVTEKRELMCYLLAMNGRILGRDTGLRELDLLRVFQKLNRAPFRHIPVSQGDTILVDGVPFEVLWPPRQVDEGTRDAIRKALASFRKALEEDKTLQKRYNEVSEGGLVDIYLDEDSATMSELADDDAREDAGNHRGDPHTRRSEPLPQSVRDANEDLRKVANHLSIAMAQGNNILFLGDLEDSHIAWVVAYLGRRHMNGFHLLVTPHHGTHWHDELENIRCTYSVSSNGARLHARKSSAFKRISSWSLNTYDCGDILLPACPVGYAPPWKAPYCWACQMTAATFDSTW
ncbi:MAG: hypothetical protein AB1700_20210, partial [Bacillota bacterium]